MNPRELAAILALAILCTLMGILIGSAAALLYGCPS